ncbi:beta strand repeat-containing protein, partial [Joostella sp.]|uniref:beta strand repeat-containing protein n=1 Tax=Joostella sp. TaxID=2231138 RepID=UPI003A92C5AD
MRNFTTQLKFCAAIICALLFNIESHAQSQTFTSSITSERFTDNSGNAIDGNLNTKANVRASSGLIVGLGSYSGRIELKFPQTVPANTTSYIKIDTDENLLPTLLGGSLGSLLSDVLGTVLIGNQEFTVQALNGGTSIITGRSEVENSMATDRLRIVVDGNGKYFIAITPNQAYDRVRLTNRLGSLVGLGNTKRLGVYDVYYATNPLECGNPSFTSFDGSGISLDLLQIGGAGVRNPQYAIDGNPANHSELNLGILSVLASIQQSIYFEGSSNTTDSFNIRLKLSPALISVGALNSINIIASNDGEIVQNIPFSSLLDVDLLSLIQIQANKNLPTSIPFSPGVPVDKITVRYSSLLNVEIAQSLDLYGITRTPALPIISESSKNVSVCIGTSADLTASTNPTDLQIRWYDAATGGNLIASTNSGDVFTTPTINEDTTFYVASVKSGCDTESARVAVHVRAIDRPTAADITITGAENDICESSNAILTPSSSINGTFNWFFDPDKVTPITDGLTQGSITYTIDENGRLTVSGLTPTDTPISYYVSITNNETGCNNANGDLAQATINVITNTLNPTITLDTNITADDVININESTTSIIISGDTGGDSQPGDSITLTINKVKYSGTVAPDGSFQIPVNGSDLLADSDLTIQATVESNNTICTSSGTDTETYTIDVTPPTAPTVNEQQTNDTTPAITGTANSTDQLSIDLNGITYTEGDGNLTDNGDNTWMLQIPTGDELPEGVYDIIATVNDAAGNSSTDNTINELTIDLTDPQIPTVTPLSTNDNTPKISGTALSEDTIEITVNGITYSEGDGNLTDNSNDTWTLQIPDGNAIPDGTYDIMVTAKDIAGNTANDNTTDELTINTLAPNAPTVDLLATNDNTPNITGTADSVDDLTVLVNGITYTEGDGNLTDNGDDTWTLQIPDANTLPDGIYDVNATASDGMLSANDSTINELTIDTTPPSTPTVNQQDTNDATPIITGTATSEDNLKIIVNGITYLEGNGDLTDNGDDTWTLQIPDANELPDGIYDVQAILTDEVGNIANDSTTDELNINTSIPDEPTVDFLATSDNTPTITGTANSIDELEITVNGITYTESDGNLIDNSDNTWALQIPDGNALPDGFYDVKALVTDTFGNTNSDTTLNELTIDTADPTIPTVNSLITNDTTPTITGTLDSQDQLSVTVNGITYVEKDGNLIDNENNTWTLNIPATNELPEGVYDVVASVMDPIGNTSVDTTTDELTIDATLPNTPTVNSLATEDTTPMINGTATSTTDLTVEVNGILYTEGDGNLTDNNDNTWTLQIPDENTLTEGVYDVIATATDMAGNSASDNTTNELTINSAIITPTTPTVDQLTTEDTTPTITGTADSNDNLIVTVDGKTYTKGDGSLFDNGDNTWALTIPTNNTLSLKTYDVVVTVMNASGGTATDTTTDELKIVSPDENTFPITPTVNQITTGDTTPIITGTADSDDNLNVSLDGNNYTEGDGDLTDNGDDTWTLQIPDENMLSEGVYDIVATATNNNGNSSTDNTTNELTITSPANTPTIPTVNQLITEDTTPIITGTADSNDTLNIGLDGNIYTEEDGNLTDNGDDTWTLQIPDENTLSGGVYDIIAVATNDSGNSSTDNTTNELTVITADDNTPPTTPTVDLIVTDDTTPIVTGTADSNDDLSIGLNGNTYNEGDG